MTSWTRRTRARLGLVSAALLLVGLAAAGCDAASGDTATSPTDGHSEQAQSPVAGEHYVALGDSYTAAPLYPLSRKPNGCLRSAHNYPALVSADLGLDMTDVSCSGASTVSMFAAQHFVTKKRPPQLDALSSDTDVVTLGIGANDYRYFTHMMFDCLSIADSDPTGAPCQAANEVDGTDQNEADLSKISHRVTKVIDAIRERAPHARIIMVGYPSLLPATGECRAKLPLATGDYAYTRELNLRLVSAVRRGAKRGGAQYVNVERASQGHDICSKDPWVAGIRGYGGRAMGLHPYPAEQRAVADLIVKLL